MFRMECRHHNLIDQVRHDPNNVRNLSRKSIEARGRRGHKVGKHNVGLLTPFGPFFVVSIVHGGGEHGQVVEDVFVRGIDVTRVGVGEGGGILVESRIIFSDPVLSHAERGLGYDLFVAKCLSQSIVKRIIDRTRLLRSTHTEQRFQLLHILARHIISPLILLHLLRSGLLRRLVPPRTKIRRRRALYLHDDTGIRRPTRLVATLFVLLEVDVDLAFFFFVFERG
mmetsp:Transcript_35560/g.74918  ORF Transcript_35560/g.74918 Transcript_35560/m.74918 type:complete len:225 (-) Transcript_35560:1609-2283(-)